MKKLIFSPLNFKAILAFLVAFYFAFLFSNKNVFLKMFDPDFAKDRYAQSSYGRTKAAYILSDEELYAIEGYFLVSENKDLHNLTPGHPPLGKYIIGLSIKLFGNPYFFAPFFGVICIWLIYKIGRVLNFSPMQSIAIAAIFSLEPLFRDQLTTSLLDIYLLSFSLSGLYLYLLWLKKPKFIYIISSQFFLGLTLATKFFLGGFPLIGALLFTTVLSKDFKRFKAHIICLAAIGFGFIIGHFSYFFYHPSIVEFLKYQRYVLSWWAGSPQVPAFQVWDLIFRNRWHTWWGNEEIISTPLWWYSWPVIFTLSLVVILKHLIKRHFPLPILSISLWFLFSVFLFSFEAVYPRHILVILPVTYLLTASLLNTKK